MSLSQRALDVANEQHWLLPFQLAMETIKEWWSKLMPTMIFSEIGYASFHMCQKRLGYDTIKHLCEHVFLQWILVEIWNNKGLDVCLRNPFFITLHVETMHGSIAWGNSLVFTSDNLRTGCGINHQVQHTDPSLTSWVCLMWQPVITMMTMITVEIMTKVMHVALDA